MVARSNEYFFSAQEDPTEVAPPRNGGAPSSGFKEAEAKSKRLNPRRLNSKRLNPKKLFPKRLNPVEDCNQYT